MMKLTNLIKLQKTKNQLFKYKKPIKYQIQMINYQNKVNRIQKNKIFSLSKKLKTSNKISMKAKNNYKTFNLKFNNIFILNSLMKKITTKESLNYISS